LNKKFPAFNSLNKELSPSFYTVDTFPDHVPSHSVNQKDTDTRIIHHNKLNNIYKNSLINQNTVFVISDASVKNNVTISALHIHRGQDIITQTVCLLKLNSLPLDTVLL